MRGARDTRSHSTHSTVHYNNKGYCVTRGHEPASARNRLITLIIVAGFETGECLNVKDSCARRPVRVVPRVFIWVPGCQWDDKNKPIL